MRGKISKLFPEIWASWAGYAGKSYSYHPPEQQSYTHQWGVLTRISVPADMACQARKLPNPGNILLVDPMAVNSLLDTRLYTWGETIAYPLYGDIELKNITGIQFRHLQIKAFQTVGQGWYIPCSIHNPQKAILVEGLWDAVAVWKYYSPALIIAIGGVFHNTALHRLLQQAGIPIILALDRDIQPAQYSKLAKQYGTRSILMYDGKDPAEARKFYLTDISYYIMMGYNSINHKLV
jgi:hypothetical protein